MSNKIDSQAILYNKEGNDESYTPGYAVEPILKHIEYYRDRYGYSLDESLIVWCPFDEKHSEFVKQISLLEDVKVVYSHINSGQDFFEYEPDKWDIIVSNPPFKGKRLFFERSLSFGKPFALLMTLTAMNDKYPAWSFYEEGVDMQLLKFDQRIEFVTPGREGNKITFQSGYMCSGFLNKNLILEPIDKPKKQRKNK